MWKAKSTMATCGQVPLLMILPLALMMTILPFSYSQDSYSYPYSYWYSLYSYSYSHSPQHDYSYYYSSEYDDSYVHSQEHDYSYHPYENKAYGYPRGYPLEYDYSYYYSQASDSYSAFVRPLILPISHFPNSYILENNIGIKCNQLSQNEYQCFMQCREGCVCILTNPTGLAYCSGGSNFYESDIVLTSTPSGVGRIPPVVTEGQVLIWAFSTMHAIMPHAFALFADTLQYLFLYDIGLQMLHPGVFNGLNALNYLDIDKTPMTEIVPGTFSSDLQTLTSLSIGSTSLSVLHSNTFENLTALTNLVLYGNKLQIIPGATFHRLQNLQYLDLSKNKLVRLHTGLLLYCIHLQLVDLRGNPLLKWIEPNSLDDLLSETRTFGQKYVLVDDPSICCFTSADCTCDKAPSPVLTCERLLPYSGLRIAIGLVGLLAFIGYLCVFYIKHKIRRQQENAIQSFLITNLSIADICMGIYLIILTSVDIYYNHYFPSFSESWRSSLLCRMAGALSVLSSEASTFFITLITFDRFMGVKYTFSKYRLTRKYARILVALLWLVALTLSTATFALSEASPDVYLVSEICVGLPLSRRPIVKSYDFNITIQASLHLWPASYNVVTGTKAAMFLSIATFTVLNPLCFFVVGYCYLSIFISARKSTKRSGRVGSESKEEIRMALKISLLVFTDFCCWVPLGILSMFVQAGVVVLDPVAYVWIALFILPFNSAINPFMFTLGSFISKKVANSDDEVAAGPVRRRKKARKFRWKPRWKSSKVHNVNV